MKHLSASSHAQRLCQPLLPGMEWSEEERFTFFLMPHFLLLKWRSRHTFLYVVQWRVQHEMLIVFILAWTKQHDLTKPPGLFIKQEQEASNCLRTPLSPLLPCINRHLNALTSSLCFVLLERNHRKYIAVALSPCYLNVSLNDLPVLFWVVIILQLPKKDHFFLATITGLLLLNYRILYPLLLHLSQY